MRKVEVEPYQEKWAAMFLDEAKTLREIFTEELLEIHHIGSTSVPGLLAKPVIDIMPVIKDITSVEQHNVEMKQMGYNPKGENGIPQRRYFEKGGDRRTHHVHFYQAGSPEIKRHLAFRDYLRTHPQDKQQYGELKKTLAKQFPYDIAAYIHGKEQLVREIESRALIWHAREHENR
ncbi:GrpB family protein [Halobacillus sp. A5]|uniref:GrpB family protein n=1 Tax=Halobacillus sp. A5 TaxID=2880263 RepID=UPI0020A68657|nr:GrpB family protein [Halobacillus sp. A5]MCP3029486.1 GrpB family protein [Halobacillus sp. A5]